MSGNDKVNHCLFLEQGAALPEDFRYLYYDSDPVSYFTVLSVDTDKGFALSYDVTEVTEYSWSLKTKTLKAAVDDSLSVPMPYKIYKGISVFNLVRVLGLSEEVDTWTNTVGYQQTHTCMNASAHKEGTTTCVVVWRQRATTIRRRVHTAVHNICYSPTIRTHSESRASTFTVWFHWCVCSLRA